VEDKRRRGRRGENGLWEKREKREKRENQCGAVGEKKNALWGEARSKIPVQSVQRACREGEGICFLLGCGWRGFGGAGV